MCKGLHNDAHASDGFLENLEQCIKIGSAMTVEEAYMHPTSISES
jgi:hypothetical protein